MGQQDCAHEQYACAICLAWLSDAAPAACQAFAMVFVVIGGWIVFRFVGPATGLYSLKSGLTDIPL